MFTGNISAKYLAEHTARMRAWRQGEVHLLVKEQESAVKAVRLERLVGNIGQVRRERKMERMRDEESSSLTDPSNSDEELTVDLTEAERRRILCLTETPRPWLSPSYNR